MTVKGKLLVFLTPSPTCCAELTFQKHNSLLDVLCVLAPDQTPGIFKPGFFGNGTLHQLVVVFLFKFLSKHTHKKKQLEINIEILYSHK